jgi:clan AA aspartic protease
MILGTVNARIEMSIQLPVRDVAGREHDIEFVIDTGYTGPLTLPTATIATLGLPWHSKVTVVLGNGASIVVDVHEVTVVWDGTPRDTFVRAIDTGPLVGMVLLQGHDLRARLELGGSVEIEAIP